MSSDVVLRCIISSCVTSPSKDECDTTKLLTMDQHDDDELGSSTKKLLGSRHHDRQQPGQIHNRRNFRRGNIILKLTFIS